MATIAAARLGSCSCVLCDPSHTFISQHSGLDQQEKNFHGDKTSPVSEAIYVLYINKGLLI